MTARECTVEESGCSIHEYCCIIRRRSLHRSIHIVALGSECPGGVGSGEDVPGQAQMQGGLLWSYLGHSAMPGHGGMDGTLPGRHALNPAFMEYQSRVFGDVRVMVQDCPSWVRGVLDGEGRVVQVEG